MAEPERKCSTCKFYEPSPIYRKGWCRNPLLYAPQQHHLVADDDLDCSRGLSDYWEAADGTGPNAGVNLTMEGGRGTEWGESQRLANSWDAGASDSYGGGRSAPPPDDDGYAPHETVSPPASGAGSAPRYIGAVGDEAGVRNPWDNSQPGYGVPPAQEPAQGYDYGYGSGYGSGQMEQQGPWQSPAPAPATEYGQQGYGQGQAHGDPQGESGAPGGYGASYPPGGYDPQGYNPQYAPGSYEQGGYTQPGYGQQGYDPQVGYGAPPGGPPTGDAPGDGSRRVGPQPAVAGKERSLSYYTEERYWTDYLKLIIPVVIVIVLLAATWFISTGKLRGSGDATVGVGTSAVGSAASGTARPGTTGTASTPAAGASVTRPTGAAASGTPQVITVPGTGNATPGGQATLPVGSVPVASGAPRPTGAVGTGKRFRIANTGGDGVNMRDKPDVAGKLITTVPENSEVQAVAGPQDGTAGGTWYQVQWGNYTGWIRSDFLTPVGG